MIKNNNNNKRNTNINLSLLFEPHNYAIQGIGINILRKFGPLLVDAITGMKFLFMYLYKKAYTAPVLVCLVSTSWLLPSLLFSLKRYNMTQLQGLLVCLDQPLSSLSIYYLYYKPFFYFMFDSCKFQLHYATFVASWMLLPMRICIQSDKEGRNVTTTLKVSL